MSELTLLKPRLLRPLIVAVVQIILDRTMRQSDSIRPSLNKEILSFPAVVSFGRHQDLLCPAVHSQNNLCPSVWLMLLWSSFSFFLGFFFYFFIFEIEQDVDENTCSVLLFLMNNLYNIKWHLRPITAGETVAVC